jgi:hypothetical protein
VPEDRHIESEHVADFALGEGRVLRKISCHDFPDAEKILSRAEHVL